MRSRRCIRVCACLCDTARSCARVCGVAVTSTRGPPTHTRARAHTQPLAYIYIYTQTRKRTHKRAHTQTLCAPAAAAAAAVAAVDAVARHIVVLVRVQPNSRPIVSAGRRRRAESPKSRRSLVVVVVRVCASVPLKYRHGKNRKIISLQHHVHYRIGHKLYTGRGGKKKNENINNNKNVFTNKYTSRIFIPERTRVTVTCV